MISPAQQASGGFSNPHGTLQRHYDHQAPKASLLILINCEQTPAIEVSGAIVVGL